jgi:hypothetical protein
VVDRARGGFTLVEAIVALTISTVVVMLVSATFHAQNRFYGAQVQRSAAHDNARMVTDMVSSEIRSVMRGGFVTAEPEVMRVSSPMVLAVVCGHLGISRVAVHIEGGLAGLDTNEISGFAVRNDTTESWSYYEVGWATIGQGSGNAANRCAANGADTVGARNEFVRLRRLANYHATQPPIGSVLMLFRTVSFEIHASDMDPTQIGLFRGIGGASLHEVVTGLDPTARFQYRAGGSSYVNTVSSSNAWQIDAVRIAAQARKRAETGGQVDVTYGWNVNVHLRNRRR